MKTNKALENMQLLLQKYSSFFNEWNKTAKCTLNNEERYIIEIHQKNCFKINLIESFMFYNQSSKLEKINAKLIWDYNDFKKWVIKNFLFNVIEFAREAGDESFLNKPIGTINIRGDLKNQLLKLNVLYLNQIFEKYKEEDLEKEKVFRIIFEFETINNLKTKSMEK